MLLNVCLLVLRLLFFEKLAGAPMVNSINIVWGATSRELRQKKYLILE